MRVVFWGTYDLGKPRVRILLQGLRQNGLEVLECHYNVWEGVEDKNNIKGLFSRLKFACRWLTSYPRLIYKYFRLPSHDAVVISYLGHLDVLILWPFAKLRGIPIVWDAFISLYNTIVEDRKLVAPFHPLALFVLNWEKLACRAAQLIVLDTKTHADYFAQEFKIPRDKICSVFVGAELEHFEAAIREPSKEGDPMVLFYGQFIPLHGVDTIIQAARQLNQESIKWLLIGKGQEAEKARVLLNHQSLPNLQWIPWVPYPQLHHWIERADICLGIFGSSSKASRVIPNKVFQALASGKHIITRDSPAIRELVEPDTPGASLVPPDDPNILAEAVLQILKKERNQVFHRNLLPRISPKGVGKSFLGELKGFIKNRKRGV